MCANFKYGILLDSSECKTSESESESLVLIYKKHNGILCNPIQYMKQSNFLS